MGKNWKANESIKYRRPSWSHAVVEDEKALDNFDRIFKKGRYAGMTDEEALAAQQKALEPKRCGCGGRLLPDVLQPPDSGHLACERCFPDHVDLSAEGENAPGLWERMNGAVRVPLEALYGDPAKISDETVTIASSPVSALGEVLKDAGFGPRDVLVPERAPLVVTDVDREAKTITIATEPPK